MRIIISLLLLVVSYSFADVYYYEYGKKVKLTKLKDSRNSNNSEVEYYQYESGRKVGVRHEVLAKCKKDYSCKDIFEKYNLKNYKNLTPKIYLITLDNSKDPFEISTKLHNEDEIEFSHPNFVKKRKRR